MRTVLSLTSIVLITAWAIGFVNYASAQEANSFKPLDSLRGLPKRIAFGSCGNQDKPQPVLKTVLAQKPDLFIYLGDNIYGDTRDMSVLKAKYLKLGRKPEFQAMTSQTPILSIWDDHDYGENDAGASYPFKEQSREIFFDFWQVPKDSPRRSHPGIYGSHTFTENGKILQVILLDTRTFRSPLKLNPNPIPAGSELKNDYQPDPSPEKTLLGDDQWKWLESQLLEPADVRIIASSIQFGHEYNGYESWTNLPLEQQKFLDLIAKTKANGVVFISGDVHWAELSKRDLPDGYPVYDLTASGITEDWSHVEASKFRVGNAVQENHFGELDFDWKSQSPTLTFKIINRKGETKLEYKVSIDDLRWPQ